MLLPDSVPIYFSDYQEKINITFTVGTHDVLFEKKNQQTSKLVIMAYQVRYTIFHLPSTVAITMYFDFV